MTHVVLQFLQWVHFLEWHKDQISFWENKTVETQTNMYNCNSGYPFLRCLFCVVSNLTMPYVQIYKWYLISINEMQLPKLPKQLSLTSKYNCIYIYSYLLYSSLFDRIDNTLALSIYFSGKKDFQTGRRRLAIWESMKFIPHASYEKIVVSGTFTYNKSSKSQSQARPDHSMQHPVSFLKSFRLSYEILERSRQRATEEVLLRR